MTSLATGIRAYLKKSKEYQEGPCAWQLCYKHFGNNPENDTEKSALHLAAFLASWGMMRGSSFLAGRDFAVHQPTVKIIFDRNHNVLRGLSISDLQRHQTAISDLVSQLREHYKKFHRDGKNPTDTLVSKILLATLGCSVGYDRFVRAGLRQEKLSAQFDPDGGASLYQWAEPRLAELNRVQAELQNEGTFYPHMKLLDMYFTSIGRCREATKEREKQSTLVGSATKIRQGQH